MDAFSDPIIEEVIGETSSQIGKTEILNNVVGYFIDQDPAPMLVVYPTLDIAKAWSKDRLTTMLRDTPALRGKVRDAKSKDADNTILHKVFPAGHISMAGSNSPASLAGRPIRIVLQDEIDRYPYSAGAEGDPCELADKRATTFWNRKKGKFSTPTVEGLSRIDVLYKMSDRRKYYVPCPKCRVFQVLKWSQMKWPKNKPEDAYYECENCKTHLTDMDKPQMLRDGEWRAEGETKGVAGFWINEIYSPWVSFGNMAVRWVKADKRAKRGDKEALRVFVNTALAETWKEGESKINEHILQERKENYGPELPSGVLILIAGVDVQVDRLELELNGYGVNEENWGIEYKYLIGDPLYETVWNELDEYLQRTWTHKTGIQLPISAAPIDSGYRTDEVYSFVQSRQNRRVHGYQQRVMAVRGGKDATMPLSPTKPSRVGRNRRVFLYNLGVNQGKDIIHQRLQEPGLIHFPAEYDEEYFNQLTNEYAKIEKGVRRWVKRTEGARTEALDIKVYSLGGLRILNVNWEKLLVNHEKRIKEFREGKPEQPIEEVRPQGRRIISPGIRGGDRLRDTRKYKSR